MSTLVCPLYRFTKSVQWNPQSLIGINNCCALKYLPVNEVKQVTSVYADWAAVLAIAMHA